MGQQLIISDTHLEGVKTIVSTAHVDERGSFSRWFCWESLTPLLNGHSIRQINHSVNTQAGTVRGMHYQREPATEYKLVRCIRGAVYDVVLDLRPDSKTFAQYMAIELSEQNQNMLLIPPGCAHGYQALMDNSQLLYLHTQDFQSDLDAGVRVDDPHFNIQWPLPIQHLSARDENFVLFSSTSLGGV